MIIGLCFPLNLFFGNPMRRIFLSLNILLAGACTFAQVTTPPAAKKLIKSYPDFFAGFSDNHLICKGGTKLLWDDGIKNKSFKDLLERPDLKDMFEQKYIIGEMTTPPAKNFDPGRVRNEALFMKIYG